MRFSKYHIKPVSTAGAVTGRAQQAVLTREADGEYTEVSLQTRVDGERAGGGVHARHVLRVVYLLGDQLLTVVPVTVDRCVDLCACAHNKCVCL